MRFIFPFFNMAVKIPLFRCTDLLTRLILKNTNLDRTELSLCVSLIENGVNPDALAVSPSTSLSCLRLTSVKRGVDCNQGFEKGGRSDFTRSPARVAWVIILFLCGVVAFTASLCSSRYPSSYCNDIFQIIVYSLCYCRYNVTVGC